MSPETLHLLSMGQAGLLRFGMSLRAVSDLLGEPQDTGTVTRSGATQLARYGDLQLSFFSGKLGFVAVYLREGLARLPLDGCGSVLILDLGQPAESIFTELKRLGHSVCIEANPGDEVCLSYKINNRVFVLVGRTSGRVESIQCLAP